MAFHLGGQISTPWIISDTSVFKMATSAQLHAMCYTVCSVLCWWTSWLLFPKTAQTHTSTSYLHMLWSRNEFNTLLSFAPWDFPHCWINFLLIWTDFPRCLCTLARQAHMCLCAGFGGWGGGAMTYCAFSQFSASWEACLPSSRKTWWHMLAGEKLPQPSQIFIMTPSFPPSDKQSKQ